MSSSQQQCCCGGGRPPRRRQERGARDDDDARSVSLCRSSGGGGGATARFGLASPSNPPPRRRRLLITCHPSRPPIDNNIMTHYDQPTTVREVLGGVTHTAAAVQAAFRSRTTRTLSNATLSPPGRSTGSLFERIAFITCRHLVAILESRGRPPRKNKNALCCPQRTLLLERTPVRSPRAKLKNGEEQAQERTFWNGCPSALKIALRELFFGGLP